MEEDRNNVDLNADLWLVERGLSKSGKLLKDKKQINNSKGGLSRNLEPNSRRKPVTVSGPYIVYMLRDSEILEDWTSIKKAMSSSNRKLSCEYYSMDVSSSAVILWRGNTFQSSFLLLSISIVINWISNERTLCAMR